MAHREVRGVYLKAYANAIQARRELGAPTTGSTITRGPIKP